VRTPQKWAQTNKRRSKLQRKKVLKEDVHEGGKKGRKKKRVRITRGVKPRQDSYAGRLLVKKGNRGEENFRRRGGGYKSRHAKVIIYGLRTRDEGKTPERLNGKFPPARPWGACQEQKKKEIGGKGGRGGGRAQIFLVAWGKV